MKILLFMFFIYSIFPGIGQADETEPEVPVYYKFDYTPYENQSVQYDNGELKIQSVDSINKSGVYQQVLFQHNDDNHWELIEYKNGRVYDEFGWAIEAKLIKRNTFPVQLFLQINGSGGCFTFGQIATNFKNNQFNTNVYSEPVGCTGHPYIEIKVIPIDIYGLSAGEYPIYVNDQYISSFTLEQDNVLDKGFLDSL